jgi:hypothetical protein
MTALPFLLRVASAALIVALLAACQASWSPRLARLEESRWVDRDRKLLLTHSPWAQSERTAITGWRADTQAILDVNASWLSSYFTTARAVVLTSMGDRVPWLLSFDPALKEDRQRFRRPLVVAGDPPSTLDRRMLVVAPLLADGLGFWPTSIAQARQAHRQLGILPPPDSILERELDDLTPLSEMIVLDVTLSPILLKHDPRPGDPDIDACLGRLMGQVLVRGASLLREDGRLLAPQQVVVLSHDIDQHWEQAAWGFTDEGLVIAAPVVARLLFPRTIDGELFLSETHAKVSLELAAPRGAAEACAKNGDGLDVRISLPFNLDDMRVVGMHGI